MVYRSNTLKSMSGNLSILAVTRAVADKPNLQLGEPNADTSALKWRNWVETVMTFEPLSLAIFGPQALSLVHVSSRYIKKSIEFIFG